MEEEEVSIAEEKTDDEEIVQVQGMWDFILPLSNNDESVEALAVTTRRKRIFYFP